MAEKFELQSKVGAMDNVHNMSVQEITRRVPLIRDESLLLGRRDGRDGVRMGEMGSELPIDSLSGWITGTWKSN